MTGRLVNPTRLQVVGVMGSGTCPHKVRARKVGRWLAEEGVHLLTGGGGGVMAAVSEAFCSVPDRKGTVIGILPCKAGDPGHAPSGYPNPWVDIPIFTHLPLSGTMGTDSASRNHINILTSRVIIALPGGTGTASEVSLARQYGHPVVAFIGNRADIPNLSSTVMVTNRFEQVAAFVRSALHAPVKDRSSSGA